MLRMICHKSVLCFLFLLFIVTLYICIIFVYFCIFNVNINHTNYIINRCIRRHMQVMLVMVQV